MESTAKEEVKKERNFPKLDLEDQTNLTTTTQPLLVIQSPKTPTLSKKLKAVSLDSDPPKESSSIELNRDVFSMPNTPKRQMKQKLSCDLSYENHKSTLAPNFSSNLKKFASNSSISGSQTLKTLPEVHTLQDFSDSVREPVKIRAKGLLERRGSNASLTIDLGSNSNIADHRVPPLLRLNTAKSVSNLNLSCFGSNDRCTCLKKMDLVQQNEKKANDRRKSQEACGNCIIYESVPSKANGCKSKCHTLQKRCSCCVGKCRRKSLSNENLYVPPCGFCQTGSYKECTGSSKHCKGFRRACYPRQPDLEPTLSEDFKLHLQNIQYLQTAGSILTPDELRASCEANRVPKLHQEFWEVPLNLQEKCYVSGSQSKNRYRGVLPNEHSRVHLPGNQIYIHANYIKGPDYTETMYIATQGPMAHTCHDFWEMIWHSSTNIIVMLTGLVEKGKNKCELYFPLGKKGESGEKSIFYVKTVKTKDKFTFDSKNLRDTEEEIVEYEAVDEVVFGNYKISYSGEEDLGCFTLRHLELSRREKTLTEIRKIRHYWFPNWQDHKMAEPEQVLKLALHVLDNFDENELWKRFDNNQTSSKKLLDSNNQNSTKIDLKSKHFFKGDGQPQRKKSMENARIPLVVHCSAGIGRTGCFLAILNGIRQLKSNCNVDVLAIVCSLRLNRGGMVQTAEQYELIHKVLGLYADRMTCD